MRRRHRRSGVRVSPASLRGNVIQEQLGHSSVGQTWEYIKNVVEASERRKQLKGGGLMIEGFTTSEAPNNIVDAVWTQKSAK